MRQHLHKFWARVKRWVAVPLLAPLLLACEPEDLTLPPEPLGTFRFGHNVVVTEGVKRGPLSRSISGQTIQAVIQAEMKNRFARYEGDGLFHIGIKVDSFILAEPGIPLVFSPKTLMILGYNVWNDATGEKLFDEFRVISVLPDGQKSIPLVPSGFTNTADEQLAALARGAAKTIEFELRKPENAAFFEPGARREHVDAYRKELAREAAQRD